MLWFSKVKINSEEKLLNSSNKMVLEGNSRVQDHNIGASVDLLEIWNLQSCYFSFHFLHIPDQSSELAWQFFQTDKSIWQNLIMIKFWCLWYSKVVRLPCRQFFLNPCTHRYIAIWSSSSGSNLEPDFKCIISHLKSKPFDNQTIINPCLKWI